MNCIASRAFTALNVLQYAAVNLPDELDYLNLRVPVQRDGLFAECHVLRMLIRRMHGTYCIPPTLAWVQPMVDMAERHQTESGLRQPFTYLTIRCGTVRAETDDEWHVDGFSKTITHLPEQNYVWASHSATQYYTHAIPLPAEFDPLRHNIHKYFQRRISPEHVEQMKSQHVYVLDPYVIHRRPPETQNTRRCFVRVSYTPIEIEDRNNTPNPYLPPYAVRDGIKDMRDRLLDYDAVVR